MSYLDFRFDRLSESGKTKEFSVLPTRSGSSLGRIAWYSHWRQYAFWPVRNTVFNPDCLAEIAEKCADLTRLHRARS